MADGPVKSVLKSNIGDLEVYVIQEFHCPVILD